MTTLFVGTNTLYQAGAGNIVGATSITLTSFSDIYGNVLTMANFGALGYITCEPDTTNQEFLTFTGVTANANGTYTLTGVKTALAVSPYTQTSGAVRQHSGGTKVVVSDSPAFWDTFVNKNNDATITAKMTFPGDNTNRPTNATDVDTATAGDLVTYGQLSRATITGSTYASTTVLGGVYLSTNPTTATTPIVVTTIDPRVPTQSENDALAGTVGSPSSSNKYVTNLDTSATTVIGGVVRRNATGDVTVSTTPTATTDAASKAYVDNATFLTSGAPGTTTTNTTATVLTYALAGGILGTNKGVKIRITSKVAVSASNNSAVYTVAYGGTSIGSFGYSGNSGTPTVTVVTVCDILLLGAGTTGTQKANFMTTQHIETGSGGVTTSQFAQSFSASIDSTTSQNITIACTAGSSVTGTLVDYFVNKIA